MLATTLRPSQSPSGAEEFDASPPLSRRLEPGTRQSTLGTETFDAVEAIVCCMKAPCRCNPQRCSGKKRCTFDCCDKTCDMTIAALALVGTLLWIPIVTFDFETSDEVWTTWSLTWILFFLSFALCAMSNCCNRRDANGRLNRRQCKPWVYVGSLGIAALTFQTIALFVYTTFDWQRAVFGGVWFPFNVLKLDFIGYMVGGLILFLIITSIFCCCCCWQMCGRSRAASQYFANRAQARPFLDLVENSSNIAAFTPLVFVFGFAVASSLVLAGHVLVGPDSALPATPESICCPNVRLEPLCASPLYALLVDRTAQATNQWASRALSWTLFDERYRSIFVPPPRRCFAMPPSAQVGSVGGPGWWNGSIGCASPCADANGTETGLTVGGSPATCAQLASFCGGVRVRKVCPVTCRACLTPLVANCADGASWRPPGFWAASAMVTDDGTITLPPASLALRDVSRMGLPSVLIRADLTGFSGRCEGSQVTIASARTNSAGIATFAGIQRSIHPMLSPSCVEGGAWVRISFRVDESELEAAGCTAENALGTTAAMAQCRSSTRSLDHWAAARSHGGLPRLRPTVNCLTAEESGFLGACRLQCASCIATDFAYNATCDPLQNTFCSLCSQYMPCFAPAPPPPPPPATSHEVQHFFVWVHEPPTTRSLSFTTPPVPLQSADPAVDSVALTQSTQVHETSTLYETRRQTTTTITATDAATGSSTANVTNTSSVRRARRQLFYLSPPAANETLELRHKTCVALQLLTDGGVPVPGVGVYAALLASRASGARLSSAGSEAITDANGTVTLDIQFVAGRTGNYTILFYAEGLVNETIDPAATRQARRTQQFLSVAGAQPAGACGADGGGHDRCAAGGRGAAGGCGIHSGAGAGGCASARGEHAAAHAGMLDLHR